MSSVFSDTTEGRSASYGACQTKVVLQKSKMCQTCGRCVKPVALLPSRSPREPSTRVRGAMMLQGLPCPSGQGSERVQHGLSSEGKQRYRCRADLAGRGRTLRLEYPDGGQSPASKPQSVERALNASGLRATARVLPGRPTPKKGLGPPAGAAGGGKAPPAQAGRGGALWPHALLPRRVGGLRTAARGCAAARGAGKQPEDRAQAYERAHAAQAVGPPAARFCQDRTPARLGDWALYQSVGVWGSNLTREQQS